MARPHTPVRTSGLGVVAIWALLLTACSPFSEDRPPVPDSTLAKVLVEMHITKALSERDTISRSLPDSVLAHYDVSRARLDSTLRYYSRHPQAFMSLYTSVIDTLRSTRYEQRSPAERKPSPPDTDSPRNGQ